ncbi:hypothetical protein RQP46_007870 [Phenoliferia psychrophenolica]
MFGSSLLVAVALLSTAEAFPGLHVGGDFQQQRRQHVPTARVHPERDLGVYGNWAPAGPTDSRSPCPGINSLANHGVSRRQNGHVSKNSANRLSRIPQFFPHNGRGISYIDFIITCAVYLGVGPTVTATVCPFGIIAGPLGDLTLDLNSLNEHNYIEHDVSTCTYLECAMVMHVTGGPLLPRPPIEYVYSFVMDERLPAHLGWSPHVMSDIEVFAVMAILELAASPNLLTEIAIFGTTTVRAILDGTIITGIINGVGGGSQTYKQGEGNVMVDGSISGGSQVAINSNSGLLGPIIGGFANLIGGNVQSIIGGFAGKPPNPPPGQNGGEDAVIGMVSSIAKNGGKTFGALMNGGQGVDLDPAHLEAMWNVPSTMNYEGGHQENLKAVQKILAARPKHTGPAWDPKTAKAVKKYVPPPPSQTVAAKPKPSASPAAAGPFGWIKNIFGGH